MTRSRLVTIVVGALLCAALVPSTAVARGPGGGGGGGGGGGEVTTPNSLSVPAIMVGGGFTGVTCPVGAPGPLVEPTGDPSSGFPIDLDAYYYVQGVNTWQAQCYTATSATATAAWGDNLAGDAKMSVGSPIRVELGLFDSTGVSMAGYTVVKLDPNALDRESKYGTLATALDGGGSAATPTTFSPVRVFDAGVTFSIQNVGSGAYVVQPGTNPTAEINATGAIVYGYNLRVTTPGDYSITFTIPSVTISGTDIGTYTTSPTEPDTVALTITVTGGGGGGGHRP